MCGLCAHVLGRACAGMRSRRALRAGGMPSGSMMASSWPSSRRYNSRRGLRGQRLHEHHTVVVSLQRESTAMATGARGGTLLRASIETDSPSAVGPGVGFRVGLRVSFAVGLPGKHWQAARTSGSAPRMHQCCYKHHTSAEHPTECTRAPHQL